MNFYKQYYRITSVKMTIKLDPKEVRAHLHRLGYYNITGEQLQDFIKGKLPILYRGKKRYCLI
jgi:hypothetical protein